MTAPRADVGFILWFPLNAAIKGDDVDWELIPVDLTVGRDLADRLTFLRNATGADAFGDAITAPVEDEFGLTEADADGPTPTPDRYAALMARHAQLSDADKAIFAGMGVPKGDLDAAEAALDRVESFADVTTAPVALTITPATEPTPPVDEGADCTADEVAAIGARYNALDPAARSWVTACGAKVRLNPASGGKASVRRRDVLSGLLAYAEGKRDADDLVRAALGHILGDIVWQGATVADTLAALTVDEAAQFAGLAALIAMTHDAFDFSVPDRTVLTPAVIERAAAA